MQIEIKSASNNDLEINGGECERKISILEALKMDEWDVITVQQVSQLSGMPESYEPYLQQVVDYVREVCPMAQIYLHQTWAYEIDSKHGGFVNYHCDQKEMYERIVATTKEYAKRIGAKMIPTGEMIQKIRMELSEFDYQNGGISLCRDGFHLSWDYGRFAAAALWLRVLTGRKVQVEQFNDFDSEKVEKILALVNTFEVSMRF